MILTALCAFAAAAVAGIFLATRHFRHKRLPVWVALLHGVGGAVGFTLVLLVVVYQPAFQLARQALYLFIATIALGCVNLVFHIRRVRHRTSLIVMHGLCAVSGVSTLLYALVVAGPVAEASPVAGPAAPLAPAGAGAKPALAQPSPAAVEVASPDSMPAAPLARSSVEELLPDEAVRHALGAAIRFESNSVEIPQAAVPVIARVATVLTQHPEITLVQVQGHADERGEDAKNLWLTRRRASAVAGALVDRGVALERLHSAGYGSRCPVDPACRNAAAPPSCHSPEPWAADRRVVFVPLRVGATSLRGELVCDRGASLIPREALPFHAP